ncbi:MAG: aminotransferase class I/II-fold pyridoxal phosphate-dependent enzyme [Euryarchaeota archaeon]|jgi:tyrosine/nicotianamine family aminotransferase|nr:aminotransferase class I/II-fold pyridoxal phosphate-dependent enzyme [Euryarchaeota archaeon]MBT5843498.1 aminotransferase class I/II-fold pyridoxal phosphate-dependent enzyme [Euryarchaeota archaeon]MBT6640744.1 aminotransferase class I/II-fold pyridoxal phosphate-dependent enzyme [Euryarchaeota archaeon]MBT6844470.1 aminotransferase class I/II-fold pyridoxal phosphate-dependent enzyme [Euryarchaeota archaeon]MBT7063147.1 aminotransferase class I/II-fold pyridoxal phosphate-dependent enzym
MSDEQIPVAARASNIEYAIRDVVVPANALEAQGHTILKLNIGDPIAYPGLPTPEHMIEAYVKALRDGKNGYSPSYGLPELRSAIAKDEQRKGWDAKESDIYVCHGVTEALQILFASVLSDGDKVLAPGPHYPPYMAYPQMYGAETIEYKLRPNDGWKIDLEDIESKMDASVRLLVLINPNNPCGSVAGKQEIEQVLSIAKKWPNCMIIADEIYDGLDFTGMHKSVASLSKDVPVFTFNGVSKVYYAPGWRIGYMAIHDPTNRLLHVRDGIERMLRSRLCASTPAQLGYLAGLESDRSWMQNYSEKVVRQRDICVQRISEIEGLEVQSSGGAFYMFVRLTDEKWAEDDKKFVLKLLHEEHVLVVHGSGFSPTLGKGHFRLVYLPDVEVLNDAFDRIEAFLIRHRINS